MEKLLPCPFCGGEAEIEDLQSGYESGTTIRCMNCAVCVSEGVEDGNGWRERAVKKWNRRAQPEQPDVTHGQWETIEVYGETCRYRCTACKTEMVDHIDRAGYHRYCHKCGTKMDGGEKGETD